jgi:uncharacterized protein YwqG
MELSEELRAKLRRTAWIPKVEEGDDDPLASKVGGTPWIPEGSEHPTCANCGRPLPLLVQLDVATLPEPKRFGGTGLIQLFYCTSSDPLCEVDVEAFFPYKSSVVARRVDAEEPGAASTATPVTVFEAKRIVGWEEREDFPNWEEREELLADLVGEDEELDDEDDRFPLVGEKLWGWPLWVQSIEYPSCQECGATMQLVMQIDSNGLLDYQWGDIGCAHLTQCPHHPDRLAFGWACG